MLEIELCQLPKKEEKKKQGVKYFTQILSTIRLDVDY